MGEVGIAAAVGGFSAAMGQRFFDKTCFRAGTPMVWEHGHKKVEEFKVGDRLAARNEFDLEGPIEWKAIEEVFVRQGLVLEVTVGGQVIGTTAEHPFYLHGKGWTPAGELQVGDLLAAGDGRWLSVEKLYNTGKLETVYNFRVADHHTYFVGDRDWGFSVWAHNASCAVAGTIQARENYDRIFAPMDTREHSRILRENLVKAGRAPLPYEDAAHIVASTHRRHAQARSILARAGVGIDDAINGGGLPSNSNVPNPYGKMTHNATHSYKKMDKVTEMLMQAESDGTVVNMLIAIEHLRQTGQF